MFKTIGKPVLRAIGLNVAFVALTIGAIKAIEFFEERDLEKRARFLQEVDAEIESRIARGQLQRCTPFGKANMKTPA